MTYLYEFQHVSRSFEAAHETIEILHDLNCTVAEGESLAIVGASGSGKSTLLHLMGALDSPTKGTILFAGENMEDLSELERARFRNQVLGFVYQFHHLLPEFSAWENVAIPALIAGKSLASIKAKAQEMLERVGLKERLDARISTLSGGERQRVAIARALLMEPRVLLADEPTGNLDEHTGQAIEDLLISVNQEMGTTLVVVTHNLLLAKRLNRCLELKNGSLTPMAAEQDCGGRASS